MTAKRLVALVVSIALVAGAFVVRSRIDDKAELASQPLRVVCATELGAACERLGTRGYDFVIEQAQVTARRLALLEPGDTETDLWLTVQPAADLVDAARGRRGAQPLLDRTSVTELATTELALVVWNDRAAVLRRTCPTVTLRCVGEVAGRGAWAASGGRADWGQVRVAFPDPEETATGLVALGTGAQSWFGRSDVASNDFDADVAFGDWLAGLARATRPGASLARMLAFGRAELDMAIAPRALADEQIPDGADVVILALAPQTPVTAVAVALPGGRGRSLDLADALRWKKQTVRSTPLAPDVLEALLLRWRELSR